MGPNPVRLTQTSEPPPQAGSHCPPNGGHTPPQGPGTLHCAVVVVMLDVVEVVMLDVVVPAQPPFVQASQQLAKVPVHALPPCGAWHLPVRLMEHFVLPWVVRQHVSKPGLPQVDRDSHFVTSPRQSLFASRLAAFTPAQCT